MTAEQLEELANGVIPIYSGLDFEEVITSLARRVLAAQKLIEKMDSVIESRHIIVLVSDADIDELDALDTTYREASK